MNTAAICTKRDELVALTHQLADAYNQQDAEAVAQMFALDGCFDNMDGNRYQGREEILRVTREKVMSVGKLNFVANDLYVDEQSSKVALQWTLTIETPHGSTSGIGTDILHWKDGQLILKSTFFKTQMPQVEYATRSLLQKLRLQLHFLKNR